MRVSRLLYLADRILPPGGIQNLSRLTISALHDLRGEGGLDYRAIVYQGDVPVGIGAAQAHGSGALMQAKVAWNSLIQWPNCIFSDHLYTARFASRLNVKHVFWAHLIEFDPPLHPMHTRSMTNSHRIACDSNVTLEHIARLYPSVRPKLRVVHLGDFRRTPLPAPVYETNLAKQQLTMIGRMEPEERYKGHDQVIEALPSVIKRFPHCLINMVGAGADQDRLERKVGELGLTKNIHFRSNLDDKRIFEIIEQSCGTLLPSLREAFGLVYLYALWAGIPAVAVKSTAGEEVLAECGVYADVQTPSSVGNAIERVLAGEWKYGAQSQHRYRDLFSYDAFKNRLRDFLFSDCLNS